MRTFFIFILFFLNTILVFSQSNTTSSDTTSSSTSTNNDGIDSKIEFERPFNMFAAAGASVLLSNHYSASISPVDYTVQFEKTFPIVTRFSFGLIWNPLPDKSPGYDAKYFRNKKFNDAYKANRKNLAVALLINVFQLSYSSSNFDSSSPIDVGFGLGYRSANFAILGTLELTPLRTPRTFFFNQYFNKDKQLVLFGNKEPVRSIGSEDNSLFYSKINPSIGVKIAYAFTKSK